MFAVPAAFHVTVTVPLLMVAVAMDVSLLATLNAPPLWQVAVNVVVVVGYVIVPDATLNVTRFTVHL